jgi:hypothetical protein
MNQISEVIGILKQLLCEPSTCGLPLHKMQSGDELVKVNKTDSSSQLLIVRPGFVRADRNGSGYGVEECK